MFNFSKLIKAILHQKTGSFTGGFIGGGVIFGNILWPGLAISFNPIAIFGLKAVAGLSLAFASGVITALAKDYYEYDLKEKIFKKRKNKKNGHDTEEIWGKNGHSRKAG